MITVLCVCVLMVLWEFWGIYTTLSLSVSNFVLHTDLLDVPSDDLLNAWTCLKLVQQKFQNTQHFVSGMLPCLKSGEGGGEEASMVE